MSEEVIITKYADGRVYKNGVLLRDSNITEDQREYEAVKESGIIDIQIKQIQPTLKELLASAKEATEIVIRKGFAIVSDEEKNRRLEICSRCYHLDTHKRCLHVKMSDGTIERGCGCYMPLKSALRDMKCPTDRW